MNDVMTFNRNNPLSISMRGSGEYVKKECANLVESFAQAEADHYEEMRQDSETDYHYND